MNCEDVFTQACNAHRVFMADEVWRFKDVVESPIEELFIAGLLGADCFAPDREEIKLHNERITYGDVRSFDKDGIRCWPQATIGAYRVDFLLGHQRDGKIRWLVVECDGHAFHEKTSAQASRDKQRDRYFMSLGLLVIHFTGSEIFGSPIGCAMEAVDVLSRASDNG